MATELLCVKCQANGIESSPVSQLLIQVYEDGLSYEEGRWHYIPLCPLHLIKEKGNLDLPLDKPWAVIDIYDEDQAFERAYLPFTVGNKTHRVIARFASKCDAELFVGNVLEAEDPIGVKEGDYYIDGPEVLFEVRPLLKGDQEGWGAFDQDGDCFGWWELRNEAEAICRSLNQAVEEDT